MVPYRPALSNAFTTEFHRLALVVPGGELSLILDGQWRAIDARGTPCAVGCARADLISSQIPCVEQMFPHPERTF